MTARAYTTRRLGIVNALVDKLEDIEQPKDYSVLELGDIDSN